APPSPADAEPLLADLRARLAALGPVNLVAIEEHQQLEERFAFLSAQNDDLERARADLRKFIRDVNDTTTALFADTFKQVDAHFQALFTRLFGGGSARLALVDEENVLESGIDIVARPPGKKPQSVSLLSGGERTLTAVALLFALFRVKPSPFCLTDELDAALDDHNISRYLDMLADFTRDTQFLVITHNRQTIARADALYGVTMEKKGVSKFVSMRFRSDLPPATEPKGTP
ncbi:MAG: AAA family ATPase, partial [Kiritimatiellae bacterium]|nr:AAA family ATPase [Kiritimatiellia bacterium]